MTASHWRLKQIFFQIFFQIFHNTPFIYIVGCVLFVATTTSSISVYYFSMCPVCGHYHV